MLPKWRFIKFIIMKYMSLNSLKLFLVSISVVLASAVLLSSCEKETLNNSHSSESIIPLDGKTEMIVIHKDDWKVVSDKFEAHLPSVFYDANKDYDFIRMYYKEDSPKNTTKWVEMPNGDFSYRFGESKIFVQNFLDESMRMQFMIVLKDKDIK